MKIYGYDYTVKCDENTDDIGALGDFRAKNQTIRLAQDLCKDQVLSTLLHEIIEAVNYHNQLKLEHQQIMVLEVGLYEVLKVNGVDLTPLLESA
jgi:hypothetical protein